MNGRRAAGTNWINCPKQELYFIDTTTLSSKYEENIMENIESSWIILMDINFKILQSKYFNDKFLTYIL